MRRQSNKPYETVIDFEVPPDISGQHIANVAQAASAGPPLSPIDHVLKCMQAHDLTLGKFLGQLFTVPARHDQARSHIQASTVSSFLGGHAKSSFQPVEVVDLMYKSREAAPKAIRQSLTPASDKHRPDEQKMARWQLREWAISVVEDIIDEESAELSSLSGGLRLQGTDEYTWDFATGFSLESVASVANEKSPTLVRMLTAAAIPRNKRKKTVSSVSSTSAEPDASTASTAPQNNAQTPDRGTPSTENSHWTFSDDTPSGRGQNRRNPFVVSLNTQYHVCLLIALFVDRCYSHPHAYERPKPALHFLSEANWHLAFRQFCSSRSLRSAWPVWVVNIILCDPQAPQDSGSFSTDCCLFQGSPSMFFPRIR